MEQTLGKRIVSHRKRLMLTQDQLAEKLGVTAQAVSKWENDQSCPDITMLPRLAEIFGISTDELLGREEAKVHHAQVVTEENEPEGIHVQKGNWEFTYDAGRRSSVAFAVLVLGLGTLLLLAKLMDWEIRFWNILWPWSLTVFGLFALIRRFSFFSLGCMLFGVYFLLDNLGLLPFTLGVELVLPILLVLFGISLLANAMKKPRKRRWNVKHNGNPVQRNKSSTTVDGESFVCNMSFGESVQTVEMPRLSEGSISTSFGDFTVDLSGVESVAPECCVSANCSFGELTVLVPSRYQVRANSSTSFAEIDISGHPCPEPEGVIDLDAHASFGEIVIRYI